MRTSILLEGSGSFTDKDSRILIEKIEQDKTSQRQGMESMVYPPDLMVFDADKNLLGRLLYDATADETIVFLRSILNTHPHLKPKDMDFEDVYAHDPEFEQLRRRFDNGERTSLTTLLIDWLAKQDKTQSDDDAMARNMLGSCLYHMVNRGKPYEIY